MLIAGFSPTIIPYTSFAPKSGRKGTALPLLPTVKCDIFRALFAYFIMIINTGDYYKTKDRNISSISFFGYRNFKRFLINFVIDIITFKIFFH